MNIYCTYDPLNPAIDKETSEEKHACKNFNTVFCLTCDSRYSGGKIKKYMEENPKEH